MRYRYLITTTAAFVAVMLTAGAWMGMASRITPGEPGLLVTALGYGDFAPLGAGRQVAALQALVGYLILGIRVSTGFQLIAPHTDPAETARKRRDRQEERSEQRADPEGEKGT